MAGLLILFAILGAWLLIASALDWDASCGVLDLQTPGILLGESVVRWIIGGLGGAIVLLSLAGC